MIINLIINLSSLTPPPRACIYVFFCSLSIRLFDLETGKCDKKLNGSHSSKVTMMNFSINGEYLVSASNNVRVINLFSVEKEELVQSFSLLHNPLHILVDSHINQVTSVVSSGEGGVVEMFRFKKQASKEAEKGSLELDTDGE